MGLPHQRQQISVPVEITIAPAINSLPKLVREALTLCFYAERQELAGVIYKTELQETITNRALLNS